MGKKITLKSVFPNSPPLNFCNALIFSTLLASIINVKREIFYDLNTEADNFKYIVIFNLCFTRRRCDNSRA